MLENTFTRKQHPDLRANFMLAGPPFNISDWWHGSLEGDPRWHFGEAFDDKMRKLTEKLGEQMAKGAGLDALIRAKLAGLGYAF